MYSKNSFDVKQNKRVYAWAYFTKNEDTKTAECRICFKILKLGQYAYNGLNGHLEGQHGITVSNYMLNFNRIEELRLGKILVYESSYEMQERGSNVPKVIEKKFGSKQQRSYVWNFCVKRNESISTCKLCLKHIKCGNSPKPLKMHLRNKHDVHEGNHQIKFLEFSSQLNNALSLLGTSNSDSITDDNIVEYALDESFEGNNEGLLKLNEMNSNHTPEKALTNKLEFKSNDVFATTAIYTATQLKPTTCKTSPGKINSICKETINSTTSISPNRNSVSEPSFNSPPPDYELAIQQQQNCKNFKQDLPRHFSIIFFHFHGKNNSICKICHKLYKVGKGSNKKLITHLWADHGINQDNFNSSMHLIEKYDSKFTKSNVLSTLSEVSSDLLLINENKKIEESSVDLESCSKNYSSNYTYVWIYFEPPTNGLTKCKICFKNFSTVKTGFNDLVRHLKQKHNIDNENCINLENESFNNIDKRDNENVLQKNKVASNKSSSSDSDSHLNSNTFIRKKLVPKMVKEKSFVVNSNNISNSSNNLEEPIEVQMLDSDSDVDLNPRIAFEESKNSQTLFQPIKIFEKQTSLENSFKNSCVNGKTKTSQLLNCISVETPSSFPLVSNAYKNNYQCLEDLSCNQSSTTKRSFALNFFSKPGLFGYSKCLICGKSIKRLYEQHLKIHSIYESNYSNMLHLIDKSLNCYSSDTSINNSAIDMEKKEMDLNGDITSQAIDTNSVNYNSYVWSFFEVPLKSSTVCKLCKFKINFKTLNLNLLKNHLAYRHKISKNNFYNNLYLLKNKNKSDQHKKNTNGVVLNCNDTVCKLVTECSLSFSQIVNTTVFKNFFSTNDIPRDVSSLKMKYMNIYDKAVANFFWVLVKEKTKEQKFSIDLSCSHKINGRTYIVVSLHYRSTYQILKLIQVFNKLNVDDIQNKIDQTLVTFGLEYSRDIVSITTNITPLVKKIGLKTNVIHQTCLCSLVSFVVKDLIYKPETIWIVNVHKNKINCDDASSIPMDQFLIEDIISIFRSSELKPPFVSVLSKVFIIMIKYKELFLKNYSSNKEVINLTTIPLFFQQLSIFLTDTRNWQCLHSMVNCFTNNQESIFEFLKEDTEMVYLNTHEQCTLQNLCTLLEYADDIISVLDDSEATLDLSYADKHMKKLFTCLQVEKTGILSKFCEKLLRAYCQVRNTTLLHLIEFLKDPDFVLRSSDDFGFDVSFRSVVLLGSELLEKWFKGAVEKYKASKVIHKSKTKSLDNFLQKIRQQGGENKTLDIVNNNKLEEETSESSNKEEDHVAHIFQSYADTKFRPKLLCLLQSALQTVKTSSFPSQRTFAPICNLTSYREDAFSMREVNAIMFMRSYYKNFTS